MSKIKFEAAKELITQKKYTEAKVILKTIDHPKAREWEAKLAQLEASALFAKPIAVMRPRQHDSNWKDFAMLAGGLAIVYLVLFTAGSYSPSKIPTQTPSPTEMATFDASANETQVAMHRTVIADDSAFAATQTAIYEKYVASLTRIPSPTYTPSMTPTPSSTPSITPTPSLTHTPRPTRTPRPTITPTATLAVTVMAPTTYYVVGPNGSSLRLCPYAYCHRGIRLKVGTAVVVVGVLIGDTVPVDIRNDKDNRWYKIQISDGGKITYQYSPMEDYGTFQPTPRPTIDYKSLPTPLPTLTYTPSPTRRP